jgi:hypothetical protein
LEIDCVGNKCGLLIDAVTVLAKIQEGGLAGRGTMAGLWFPYRPSQSQVKYEILCNDGELPSYKLYAIYKNLTLKL